MSKIRIYLKYSLALALLLSGTAFGAFTEKMKHFNALQNCYTFGFGPAATQTCSGTVFLSQSSEPCELGATVQVGFQNLTCIATTKKELTTVEDVNKVFHEMVATVWDARYPLELLSDIDLGGFDENTPEGTCDAQAVPLDFVAKQSFLGGDHYVKNFCYVHDIADSVMSAPVGLFRSLPEGYAANIRVKNVRIVIKDSRADRDAATAADSYYPVGALFGSVDMATVENVVLEDVSISAPIAGGVAGFASNSTIRNIRAIDDIDISNKLELTPASGNYAGVTMAGKDFAYKTWPSEYTVFLGGVVGMAVKDSLYNVRVRGKIRDFSSVKTPSALGGLAGMMAYADMDYGAFNDTLELKTATATSGAGLTTISGGRAMGGLFGEVSHMSPSSAPNSYTIQNAFVDSVRILGGVSSDVYAGGLVGRVSFVNGNRIKILNSRASVDISDSLATAGDFRYYAGGILGATSDCSTLGVADNNETAFLSVVGAKSSGAIRVAANATEVSGLNAEVFLGGIAGQACFTAAPDAFQKDTSTVVVESAVKTGSDSVFVGGLVGVADIFKNKTLTFKDSRFNGRVIAADSTDKVYMGGALGAFIKQTRSVAFSGVSVNSPSGNVVELRSEGKSAAGAKAFVGGLCGYSARLAGIALSSVVGGLLVEDSDYAGDSLYVGGLVGSAESDMALSVNNTFSVGAVQVKSATRTNPAVFMGYLMGRISMTASLARVFTSNYHYSEDDVDYIDAFGKITNGDTDVTGSWKSGVPTWTLRYNVRNADTKDVTASLINGTLTEADMKKSEFAGDLNREQKPYVWSFETGYNDNLPFFADESHQPVAPNEIKTYTVTFVYYVWDDESSAYIKKNHPVLAESGTIVSSVAPEVPEREGYTFTGWDKGGEQVTSNMGVTAQYTLNSYTIVFMNGDRELKTLELKYQEMPSYDDQNPEKEPSAAYRYVFKGWSPEITKVVGSTVYKAVFDSIPNRYKIRFVYSLGTVTEGDWEYGAMPICEEIPRLPASASHTYTFKGWSPEVTTVVGEQTYTALFDSTANTFKVTFIGYKGDILDIQTVSYGDAAVAPKETIEEGKKFVGWSKDFSNVTDDLLVLSLVETALPNSSSSVELPSSSSVVVPESSSSVVVPESSSSVVVPESSSSVVEPESSSSVVKDTLRIVEPKIEQSGSAIRLTFGSKFVTPDEKVSAKIELFGENGDYRDTVITESLEESVRTEWELFPAPMGKFTVVLTLDNGDTTAVYKAEFEVASEIAVTPRSWQMVSLAAFNNTSNSFDAEQDALYWWDESNPVGEYWQYRSYKVNESNNPSRGYWYGTRNGNPLILKEESPIVDSKLVWHLDSVYSGWNLVANPHGWTIDLKNGTGGDVEFWQWNPVKGGYEIPEFLGPYEAVWAKVKEPTTWTISTKPVYNLKKTSALAKSAGEDWSVRVILADEFGKQDGWNFISVGKAANMEEPPAGMGDHVNLSIVDNGKYLAKSVKPIADEYVWQMEVSASDYRDGFLTFEGVGALAAKGLKMFVTVNGKTTEVSEGQPVKVLLKDSSTPVTVRVARSGVAVAKAASLGELRTVQRAGLVDIGFDVPANMAGANVQVDIVSLDGKVVNRSRFTANAGSNIATLSSPHRGLYYVRVRAGNLTAIKKTMVR